ncbi:MAG: hypothetical protein ABIQ95_02615 [Bdellovibrionia bacterium]
MKNVILDLCASKTSLEINRGWTPLHNAIYWRGHDNDDAIPLALIFIPQVLNNGGKSKKSNE